eukprot:s1267_g11.t1
MGSGFRGGSWNLTAGPGTPLWVLELPKRFGFWNFQSAQENGHFGPNPGREPFWSWILTISVALGGLLNSYSGNSGKRAFWAKSWPGVFLELHWKLSGRRLGALRRPSESLWEGSGASGKLPGSLLEALWEPSESLWEGSGASGKLSGNLLEAFWKVCGGLRGIFGSFEASGSLLGAFGQSVGAFCLCEAFGEPFGNLFCEVFRKPFGSLLGLFYRLCGSLLGVTACFLGASGKLPGAFWEPSRDL